MAIYALVPQCALSVLSYSEYKIDKMFQGFSPGYYWGGWLHHADLPAAQRVLSLLF